MKAAAQVERLLVVLPNWVGDVVAATPTLSALRAHFRPARITYLLRCHLEETVAGGGWHDDVLFWPRRRGGLNDLALLGLARELRGLRADVALLLTNSFRAALVTWLAGIPRRVGYGREARSWMLTDRLRPLKRDGVFVPSPILPYYCQLAEYLGCPVTERRVRLGLTPAQEEAGRRLLRHYELEHRRYALINPGAAFGAAKCWLPERFAEVCVRLTAEYGMRCVVVGAPHEAPLMRRIVELAEGADVACCDNPGTTLGSLKVLARHAALLVCNDTGPRHYGHAFNVPTVTLFGPTHQEWTDTDYPHEIKLQVPVECGPCQLKVCPVDHRCMQRLTTDRVLEAVRAVLARAPTVGRRPATCAAGA